MDNERWNRLILWGHQKEERVEAGRQECGRGRGEKPGIWMSCPCHRKGWLAGWLAEEEVQGEGI